MNCVQLFYDVTHGALYCHHPIELPYGPLQPHIDDQKFPKIHEKTVWQFLPPQPPILPITLFYGPRIGIQLSCYITHGALYTIDPLY